MNLDQIQTECFILALFIREDGERILLGSGAYAFKDSQAHFSADSYVNDIVEVQGNDGVFLAGQVRRPTTQVFNGYIGDASVSKVDTEQYRRDFLAFFRKDFYYTVVYVFPNGTAIQRRKGFIVDAPEVKELYQMYPEYHVGLNFEDVNYYSYSENEQGEEIYTKSALVNVSTGSIQGGLVWDSVGIVWDSVGAVWEEGGGGGPTTVMVDSIDRVYPVWRITGPTVNPQLAVIESGTTLSYAGTITETQVLEIDMFNRTAKLNGTSVIGNISGDWVYFRPGNNRVVYTTNNADADPSMIYWQEVVG
jgi:hypothetical protein